MTKYEFLEGLRAALAGEIPESVIAENIRFYEHYIEEEIKKGREEQAILEEFGSPRLIAKTIMETWQSSDTDLVTETESQDYTGQGTYWEGDREAEETPFQREEKAEQEKPHNSSYININGKNIRMDAWYLRVVPILIAVLIIVFVIWIIASVLHLTVSILTSPIFWVLLAVIIVINLFRWCK